MNWVDWIILTVAALSVFSGVMKGAVRTIASVAGLLVGFLVASRESGAVGVILSKWMPEPAAAAVGFVVVFLGIAFAVSLAAWLLRKMLEGVALGWADRLAGAALGLVRAVAILGVLAIAIQSQGPFGPTTRSTTFPWVLEGGRWLLHLVPEDTLKRLDWDTLKQGLPFGGSDEENEII